MDSGQWRETQILLLDTMGELPSVYSLGHIALVGGGWLWHGGHNPIEPIYWGLPTLIGPGSENFEDLVQPLLEAGCLQVVTPPDIAKNILRLLSQIDPSGQRQSPIEIPTCLSGCLQRTWDFLTPYLPTPSCNQT
jgi:3-deoxy-D-manno-octulosonic-acid transferase